MTAVRVAVRVASGARATARSTAGFATSSLFVFFGKEKLICSPLSWEIINCGPFTLKGMHLLDVVGNDRRHGRVSCRRWPWRRPSGRFSCGTPHGACRGSWWYALGAGFGLGKTNIQELFQPFCIGSTNVWSKKIVKNDFENWEKWGCCGWSRESTGEISGADFRDNKRPAVFFHFSVLAWPCVTLPQ